VNVARPDFLTFSELADRWGYSAEYLHDLIRTGQIVPSVALTDQERYVGGEFRGGYFVGDIENARHKSYSEFYVGTIFGKDDHYENWPQTTRIVFCHSPADDPSGGYSFQFISESPNPGETSRWFYLDRGARIGRVEGERRFRFTWSEIERFEAGGLIRDKSDLAVAPDGAVLPVEDAAPRQPLPDRTVVQNTLKNRNHVLDAEIAEAGRRALSPGDAASVWSELVKMAEKRDGCLLGTDEGEVKYDRDGEVCFFKKKHLADRLRRAKAR
jgi:hypothetical protein